MSGQKDILLLFLPCLSDIITLWISFYTISTCNYFSLSIASFLGKVRHSQFVLIFKKGTLFVQLPFPWNRNENEHNSLFIELNSCSRTFERKVTKIILA